ncbi:hypothetical protein BDR06DRAFT_1015671, partial [Suillus hirtellus]
NYASALAFELRRGPTPEDREFIRIKFKNGTNGDFETYYAFGHKSDIAAMEFIYRIENYAITSHKQWAAACSSGLDDDYFQIGFQNAIFSTFWLLSSSSACSSSPNSSRAPSHPPQSQYPKYGTLSNNVVPQPTSMSEKQRLCKRASCLTPIHGVRSAQDLAYPTSNPEHKFQNASLKMKLRCWEDEDRH